eukprot:973945-Prymnesium_polylepis.2
MSDTSGGRRHISLQGHADARDRCSPSYHPCVLCQSCFLLWTVRCLLLRRVCGCVRARLGRWPLGRAGEGPLALSP